MQPHSKLVWVLPDLGYYHHARIEAYARVAQTPPTVIEISDTSNFTQFKFKPRNVRECSYELRTLFFGCHYAGIPLLQTRAKLFAELDAIEPDILLIQGWAEPFALLSLDYGLKNHIPTVVTSESQAADAIRYSLAEACKKRIVSLFSAALVGGQSHREYISSLGMPKDRIQTGYNIVDNNHFMLGADQARQESIALRSRRCLPERYFLASARFIRKKNLFRLIEAYRVYRQSSRPEEPWKLLILGDGNLRPQLEQLCTRLMLTEDVLMPGFQAYQELPVCYALAGAFVHPSTVEQWGLVVNEAMASGLPVIVSRSCGCAPDLVQEGLNGYLFDPYRVEELADIMLKMTLMSEHERKEMGAASRLIISDWGPKQFAEGLRAAVQMGLEAGVNNHAMIDRFLLWAVMLQQSLSQLKEGTV